MPNSLKVLFYDTVIDSNIFLEWKAAKSAGSIA